MRTLLARKIAQGRRQLSAALAAGAQRRRKNRQHVQVALLQCVDQCIDEARIAAHPVRPIKYDTHAGTQRCALGQPVGDVGVFCQIGMVNAVLRQRQRGRVTKTGQQQAIRQIAQQLGQVDAAAGLKIRQCLLQHIGRHRRDGRQFRVGLASAADRNQIPALTARFAHQFGKTGHAAKASQHPQHDDARRAQLLRQQGRHVRLVVQRLQIDAGHQREIRRHLPQRAVQHRQVVGGMGQQRNGGASGSNFSHIVSHGGVPGCRCRLRRGDEK